MSSGNLKILKFFILVLIGMAASIILFILIDEVRQLKKDRAIKNVLERSFVLLGRSNKNWRVCTNLALEFRQNCGNEDEICNDIVRSSVALNCLKGSYSVENESFANLTPYFAFTNQFGRDLADFNAKSKFIVQTCNREYKEFSAKLCQEELEFEIENGPTGAGP